MSDRNQKPPLIVPAGIGHFYRAASLNGLRLALWEDGRAETASLADYLREAGATVVILPFDEGIDLPPIVARDREAEAGAAGSVPRTSLPAEQIFAALPPEPLAIDAAAKPFVILTVGVNGVGKTTSIAKLAHYHQQFGRSVMLAAGDTFRAAAIDQLKIWAERSGATVMAREPGADAAGLAFDAVTAAKNDGTDVVLIDTAGRLQNRSELMDELHKIVRVIRKVEPAAPHAVLLVLDATVGQNALSQVEVFGKTAGVTGLVMTKLDGTARGGILVAIAAKFGLPVHFVGVGEGIDDLSDFSARDFARAIVGLDSASS